MIERIHLTILREIEREGSLTSAAQKLCLSQSALSHAIKKLETQIQTPLWTKEGRQLQLTEAGHYLLTEAKRVLPQLARIDEALKAFADGERGTLRIGMECHPCYRWLLNTVQVFLDTCPGVDVDVKQKFQFGGMAALFNHDIDLLVTPDPIEREGIDFVPVFDYEQVLAVNLEHPFTDKPYIKPHDISTEVLYSYPVAIHRLDIFSQFLMPAKCLPKQHKTIEATEIMLQLVAAKRGVATLPRWLIQEYEQQLPITAVKLGKAGIHKHIHLGIRANEPENSFARTLIQLSRQE